MLAALLWPGLAPAQQISVDPTCPQGDLQTPRPPGSACIGRVRAGYEFAFIYSPEAAAIPALARLLRAEARRSEAWIAGVLRDSDPSTMPYSYEEGWRVDVATPVLVAASANIMYFTGGAHGGIAYRALLLDRRRGRRLVLADIITDLAAVQDAFCPALRAAVRERLESDSRPDCPDVATQEVTLSAGPDGRVAALVVLLAPYVVGSWAEGPYEIEVPLTPELLALVRPAYRSAFAPAAR